MYVSIEKQEDGTYIAYNKGDDSMVLIGTGDTVAEAKEDFFNSIEEMGEGMTEAERREHLTEPEFHFDLSSLFEYYKVINISAFARMIGMNATLLRQYKRGGVYVSDKQVERIERGIHELGRQLCDLRLS